MLSKLFRFTFLAGIALVPIDLVVPLFRTRFTLAELFLSLAFLLWLMQSGWRITEGIPGWVFIPLLAFLAACSLSIIAAHNAFIAVRETVQFFWLSIMLYFLVILFSRQKLIMPAWQVIVLAAVVSSIVGLYQYFFFRQPLFELIADTRFRARGFFDQPNTFGSFLSSSLLIMVGLYVLSSVSEGKEEARVVLRKRWLYAAIGISSAGLAATFSRGSLIALAAGLIVFGFLHRRHLRALLMSVAACIVAMTIIFVDASGQPKDRLIAAERGLDDTGGARSFSDRQRMVLLHAAFRMFLDYPVLGVGIGNFPVRLLEYTPPDDHVLLQRDYDPVQDRFFINPGKKPTIEIVHNVPLQIACETGLLGFLSFLIFIIGFFYEGTQRLKSVQTQPEFVIRATSLSAVIAMLAGGMFGWPFSHGTQELLIMLMAIPLAPSTDG